ncbi:MAG TPA: sensor domain-containing diguanylate cyclase [Solirubrobacteraceae bacterium]|nr:sensor domain-containing diguanylate cyclase [Solirubrobacteraceae bacterium]
MYAVRDLRSSIRAFAPFSAAAVLAWTIALIGSRVQWGQYALACVLAVAAGALAVRASRDQQGTQLGLVPAALLFLAAVAFLRNSVGGSPSGTSALAMIPVFHTALYGRSRRQLAVVVAGVGLFYLLPILIVGPPSYPHSQYRSAVLSVAVSSIVGFATQQLVASVRRQARQAREREGMLQQLGDVVHRLFDSPHPRIDVCQAAKSISSARVALLYEPATDGDGLVCTAVTEREAASLRQRAGTGSAVEEAFATRQQVLVTTDVESRVGSRESWIATGRPRSVLYQPLTRHGVAQGVLVVGWPDEIQAGGAHTTIASLLAHEAAAVIARADVLDNLADEAQTDPLTGLPNRRAWDAQVKRLHGEGGQFVIAMIDFDHFKRFNDTYGHPAGDRLLKETAAAWRDQLRTGDVLARLGGEEFGLLLRDCDPEVATEVTERLRRSVSEGWTCSAGIAVGGAGESVEDIIARADVALYEAKAAGRDRTHLAPLA